MAIEPPDPQSTEAAKPAEESPPKPAQAEEQSPEATARPPENPAKPIPPEAEILATITEKPETVEEIAQRLGVDPSSPNLIALDLVLRRYHRRGLMRTPQGKYMRHDPNKRREPRGPRIPPLAYSPPGGGPPPEGDPHYQERREKEELYHRIFRDIAMPNAGALAMSLSRQDSEPHTILRELRNPLYRLDAGKIELTLRALYGKGIEEIDRDYAAGLRGPPPAPPPASPNQASGPMAQAVERLRADIEQRAVEEAERRRGESGYNPRPPPSPAAPDNTALLLGLLDLIKAQGRPPEAPGRGLEERILQMQMDHLREKEEDLDSLVERQEEKFTRALQEARSMFDAQMKDREERFKFELKSREELHKVESESQRTHQKIEDLYRDKMQKIEDEFRKREEEIKERMRKLQEDAKKQEYTEDDPRKFRVKIDGYKEIWGMIQQTLTDLPNIIAPIAGRNLGNIVRQSFPQTIPPKAPAMAVSPTGPVRILLPGAGAK